jgi:hypothetical protein
LAFGVTFGKLFHTHKKGPLVGFLARMEQYLSNLGPVQPIARRLDHSTNEWARCCLEEVNRYFKNNYGFVL